MGSDYSSSKVNLKMNMVWLLDPQATTPLPCKSASVGAERLQKRSLCLVASPTFSSSVLVIPDCSFLPSCPSLKPNFFTLILLLSSHKQTISECREIIKQTAEWPESHRLGVCIFLGGINKPDKGEGWALKNFSVSCSQSSPAMRFALSAGWMFSNMCILLNLKGASLKMGYSALDCLCSAV